nr:MAG TPA: tail protein [Caudoviricetes sp.]
MLTFYDEKGNGYGAQVEFTTKNAVNGERSVSGTILSNDKVLSKIDRGWSFDWDGETYKIIYAKPKDEGRSLSVSFDAVHQFFYDFDHSNCYQVFNGSNRFEVYIEAIFKNSGYRYVIEAEAKAIRKENFGNAKRLSMFKDVIKAAGLEFSVTGKVVRIVKKVGTDLSTVVRKNFNMNELALEKNIGGFITYKKGFGAWKDENNHDAGRYETEYESPLARVYGRIEGEPISDERYKETGKLLERIKHDVDNSYSISVQLEMEDLTRAGYKYTQPRAGDYIMAINETIGFREKIRIVSYESSYDVTGRLINHKVTCNDIGTVQKAISSEGSIMRSVSQSKEYAESALAIATRALVSADGKNTIYYGAEKPRDQPRGTLHSGDLLYLTVGEETELYFWNGSEWELKILKFDSSKLEKMFADSKASTDQAIAEANKRAEEALKKAGTLPDTTKLSDQIKQQILASQDLTQKITETLNQTDSGVVYNKVLQNIKNDFVEQKDINPVLAGLNQKIATQTIEFQKLTESNKLYERIIGTSETDAPDKLSRLVMSSEIFQTEVGKYAKDDFNLVYDPTNFSKWKKKQPEANVVEVPASTKLLRITNSGNANNVYRGFALPLTTSTFTKDEKISYRLEAWVDVLPDKPLGIELWNDNSVIASDRVTFTKTGRQVITGTMTVNKTTNESRDYPLEFWLLKNGTVAIGKVSLIRGDRPPNKFMDNTSTQDIATQTKVTQLDGSYSIRNLRSAGDVLGQINLNPDGSVRINEGLLSVGEKTIIKDGVIKKSMIGKAQIGTAHIDEIDASKANLINVTAKNVATEGLTANIIKGGKLSSLNGVTDFDLQTGWLEMNKEQVGIRNKFDGKPMQFLVFGQGAINGVPCAYTQLMSNRNGTTGIEHTSAGIQIWNGRQGSNVQTAITFYGKSMDFAPSSVAGGVTLNTETKEIYGLNNITTGNIYLSGYGNNNLKALFNDIYENIRKLHAVKESRVNYSYKMLGPIQ